MISYESTSYVILALYALSAVVSLIGLLRRAIPLQTKGCALCAAAFLLQTLSLALGFHKQFAGGLSGGAYMQMVAWFIALTSLLLWLTFRNKSAIAFSSPLCTLLFAVSLPFLAKSIILPASLDASFYVFHIGFLYVSIALMSVAAVASALFLFLERRIKGKQRVRGFLQDIPALRILDKINGICCCALFPAYTIGIVAGLLRTGAVYGSVLTGDPKECVSFCILALLALLFHNRLARSWTGKKPAITMLLVFALSLFSLLIINTVMVSNHAFVLN